MTNEEFQNLLVDYINSLQLPVALSIFSQMAKMSKDPASNKMAQTMMAAATGSQSDTERLIKLLRGVVDYFDQIEGDITNIEGDITTIEGDITSITGSTPHYGVGTVAFGGGVDEHNTCTITSDNLGNIEWVNANSIWFGQVKMATSSGPTYHFFQCSMGAYDPTPTAYLEIIVYCPTAPAAGNYDVYWVGYPNA